MVTGVPDGRLVSRNALILRKWTQGLRQRTRESGERRPVAGGADGRIVDIATQQGAQREITRIHLVQYQHRVVRDVMRHSAHICPFEQHALNRLLDVELPLLSLGETAALAGLILGSGSVLTVGDRGIDKRRLLDCACRPALVDLESRRQASIQRGEPNGGVESLQTDIVTNDGGVHDSVAGANHRVACELIGEPQPWADAPQIRRLETVPTGPSGSATR